MLPHEFTSLMVTGQDGIEEIPMCYLDVEEALENKVATATNIIEVGKAIGDDGVHIEMLKVSPSLMYKPLTKIWRRIGRKRVLLDD